MKFFFVLSLIISFSAMASGVPQKPEEFRENRNRIESSDVYLRLGNCQTTGQLDPNAFMLTTTLPATVRRTSITNVETRVCHKTGWFSKSCTPWKLVSRSAPKVTIESKDAYTQTKIKCEDDTLEGILQNQLDVINLGQGCELVRQTLQDEIRNNRQ